MFESFCQHPKCQHLCACHGRLGRHAVNKNAGQVWHLRNPASVLLLFALDRVVHGCTPFLNIGESYGTPAMQPKLWFQRLSGNSGAHATPLMWLPPD